MHCDLTCPDCNVPCDTAGSLLQHFANHINKGKLIPTPTKHTKIPDLYPIDLFKNILSNGNKKILSGNDSEENVDSGIEDSNPLLYCSVSLSEDCNKSESDLNLVSKIKHSVRKYKCGKCHKSFGWPTDLKRHLLTHTGEKPFKCSVCDMAFTRKFLLQNHEAKIHSREIIKNGIPLLKPLFDNNLLDVV